MAGATRASADEDLLWGLRGGGGTLGVVTAARYRVHPVPRLLAGFAFFPVNQAAAILRGFRELAAEAPAELGVMTGFLSLPDVGPVVLVFMAWSGAPEAGAPYADRVRELGTPLLEQIAPGSYQDALAGFGTGVPAGRGYAMRTRWLPGMDADCADVLETAARDVTSPYSMIAVHHFHGRAARIAPDATAFALRREHLMVEILAAWEGPHSEGARHRAWADELDRALEPYALPGGYPNLLAPDETERLETAYGRNAARLRTLWSRHDPDGMFAAAIGGFTAAGSR